MWGAEMIVYHGSAIKVKKPDVFHSRDIGAKLSVCRKRGNLMEANPILLQKKYARVVEVFAELSKINVRTALDFFYQSTIYKDMSEGISDMHCRSDKYLAEELRDEYEIKAAKEKVSR